MTAHLGSLERQLARTALRVRLAQGLDWACWACTAAATGAGLWLLREPSARWTLTAAAAVTVLSFAVGGSRRVSRSVVSAAIDRAGNLAGRVRAASDFMDLAPASQTEFMRAALRDAAARARDVHPAQAVPLRRPRAAWPALLAVGVGGLLGTRSPTVAPSSLPVEHGATAPLAQLLTADELDAHRDNAHTLAAQATGSRLSPQLTEYLTLLARLEADTLNQEAALQQVLALESAIRARVEAAHASPFAVSTPTSDAGDSSDLGRLASELADARPALARALASGAWSEAARQLRELAKQTREGALEAGQRARLSAALEQARERERARLLEQQREQALERALLQEGAPGEPSLLKRRVAQQRELDTLRRKQATRPRRVLERLSRELARLATALSDDDRSEAEDALDDAADALDQHERALQDDTTESELARELAQLREQLQQRALAGDSAPRSPQREPQPRQHAAPPEADRENSGAAGRRERALRFDLEARGQRGIALDGGSGAPSAEAGNSGAPNQRVLLGERTQRTLVTRELAASPGSATEAAQGASSGGAEHDARELLDPTRSRGHYEDRALHGVSGAGPLRSQVIRSAASGGFASAPYRKVYADYRAHEEAALDHERVPAGYRYHVRRYFELVRPRAGQDGRR